MIRGFPLLFPIALLAAAPYQELQRLYEYDRAAPLELREAGVEHSDSLEIHNISYASPKGGRVEGYLVVPPGRGPFAGMLFMHGAGGNRKGMLPQAILYAKKGAVCLTIDAALSGARAIAGEKKAAAAKSPADLAAQSPGFGAAQYATAAAWAPNPKNPPLYFDLPTKDGVLQPEIAAKYSANAPLAFVDQYIGNLKQYRAISMDVGDQDGLRFDATKLHTILDNYGVANSFEVYSGTHVSAVADRFQNHVMPFFSKNLCFSAACK